MNRLFKNITGMSDYGSDSFLHFPIQLAEDKDHILVRTLTPGMKQKDLHIVLSGQTLSITGRIPCRSGRFLRQECPCGAFRRDIDLGCLVDGGAVKAELKSGVLTITMFKHKKARRQSIRVKHGD